MQEDKEPAFDATRTVIASLDVYAKMIEGAKFNLERMSAAARGGYLTAVDLTDYLVIKGVPFRETHHIVGRLVKFAIENGKSFEQLTLEEFKKECGKFEKDVFVALDPAAGMNRRSGRGAASPAEVRRQIKKAKKILALDKR